MPDQLLKPFGEQVAVIYERRTENTSTAVRRKHSARSEASSDRKHTYGCAASEHGSYSRASTSFMLSPVSRHVESNPGNLGRSSIEEVLNAKTITRAALIVRIKLP